MLASRPLFRHNMVLAPNRLQYHANKLLYLTPQIVAPHPTSCHPILHNLLYHTQQIIVSTLSKMSYLDYTQQNVMPAPNKLWYPQWTNCGTHTKQNVLHTPNKMCCTIQWTVCTYTQQNVLPTLHTPNTMWYLHPTKCDSYTQQYAVCTSNKLGPEPKTSGGTQTQYARVSTSNIMWCGAHTYTHTHIHTHSHSLTAALTPTRAHLITWPCAVAESESQSSQSNALKIDICRFLTWLSTLLR